MIDTNTIRVMVFSSPVCPRCPAVKEEVKAIQVEHNITGQTVDVTEPQGRKEAIRLCIQSVPTVIVCDSEKNELFRAQTATELRTWLHSD